MVEKLAYSLAFVLTFNDKAAKRFEKVTIWSALSGCFVGRRRSS